MENYNKPKPKVEEGEIIKNLEVVRNETLTKLKEDSKSPEAITALKKWYDMQFEKFVEKNERDPYPMDWEVANLYIEAGMFREAYDKLNQLANVAWINRDDEWVDKCNVKIDEINNRKR